MSALPALLEELMSDTFLVGLEGLREGREDRVFESDEFVQRLQACLKAEPDTRPMIEALLDRATSDLKMGHMFVHQERLMALFFAMQRAGVPYLASIVAPVAAANAAELGGLSRFATRLLRDDKELSSALEFLKAPSASLSPEAKALLYLITVDIPGIPNAELIKRYIVRTYLALQTAEFGSVS